MGSVYIIVDFICKGYLELSGTRVERELQNAKILAHCGIRTRGLLLFITCRSIFTFYIMFFILFEKHDNFVNVRCSKDKEKSRKYRGMFEVHSPENNKFGKRIGLNK